MYIYVDRYRYRYAGNNCSRTLLQPEEQPKSRKKSDLRLSSLQPTAGTVRYLTS